MMHRRFTRYVSFVTVVSAASALAACGSDSDTLTSSSNAGTVVVRLTDAPFSTDSVKSVDIFVTRVDARVSAADSAAADQNVDDASAGGWQTVATPNTSYNLLALQHGATSTLGETALPTGTYNGLRLIIDPSKSSVTLKNGLVLTSSSSPSVMFPSAAHSGLKINLAQPLSVTGGGTTTLLVDFDVNNSFVQRGNSIEKNGLIFKPTINATVTNAASVLATLGLVNATSSTLNLVQNGTVLANGGSIAFGNASSCTSVAASNPLLTVTEGSSTTALPGFAPSLTAGTSYMVVAYPGANNATQFATLSNAFAPASGQAGLRIFNATSNTTALDVYLTALNAVLGTATTANVAAGASSSFVSVPAGSSQIRVTGTGSQTVLLDLGAQSLLAGKNMTLVIAPPATGTTTLRAFLVPGC